MSGSFNMGMNGHVWVCKGGNVISGKLEKWKIAKVEKWKSLKLRICKSGKVEKRQTRKVDKWKIGKLGN